MTEDEAKTKICHRIIGSDGDLTKDARCIGSNCMAWRVRFEVVQAKSRRPLIDAGWLYNGDLDVYTKTSEDGYCGLAGKP